MPWQHSDVTNQNYILIIGSSSFADYMLMPLNNYFIMMDEFGKGNSLWNAKINTTEKVQIFKGSE